MNNIVIEIKGGCVSSVISGETVLVDIVDWDNIEQGDFNSIEIVSGLGADDIEKYRIYKFQEIEKIHQRLTEGSTGL